MGKSHWSLLKDHGRNWEPIRKGTAPSLGTICATPGKTETLLACSTAKPHDGANCFWGKLIGQHAADRCPDIVVGWFVQNDDDESSVRLTVRLPEWFPCNTAWVKKDMNFAQLSEAGRLDICALKGLPYILYEPVSMSLNLGDGSWWYMPQPASTGGKGMLHPVSGKPTKRYQDGRKDHESRRLKHAQKIAQANAEAATARA